MDGSPSLCKLASRTEGREEKGSKSEELWSRRWVWESLHPAQTPKYAEPKAAPGQPSGAPQEPYPRLQAPNPGNKASSPAWIANGL